MIQLNPNISILVLGGTHLLISFVESVRKLIKNGGSYMLKKTAFAGIGKMSIGKKIPINVRALRVVVNID